MLVLVTLTAYLNAWPNTLILDDNAFAASERFAGLSLSDTANFFTEDLWAANGGTSGLYRPLLIVSIAMDAYVYGDWVAGYHVTNILLHLLVTILVFGFIRYLLRVSGGQSPRSDHIALLAAMVFGVHPIHTEVVNSIFNRSGLLVSLGVVGGLWWFLRTLESSPRKAWGGLALAYLLVLFCKESAVILPALAVAMLWIFTPGDWRVHVRKSFPVFWLLVPLGIYLTLRAHALDVPGVPDATGTPETKQIIPKFDSSTLFDWKHLLPAARVWFDSMRLIMWPDLLLVFRPQSSTNGWIALVLQLALFSLAIVEFCRKRYGLIAGLSFFYIAILPASRIIVPMGLGPHLSERFLYLPSVGPAIALAFALMWLTQRFSLRAAMAPVFTALVILTPITLARNAEWASDVRLYENEYRNGIQDGEILRLLVGAYMRGKNYSKAIEICDRYIDELKTSTKLSHRCGLAFGQVGRFDDAEKALFLALNSRRYKATIHQKLASLYLHLGRRSEAVEQFELSTVTEHRPAFREYRKANMLMKLYPSDRARLLEAKAHLERALQLQPQLTPARQSMAKLNQVLGNG